MELMLNSKIIIHKCSTSTWKNGKQNTLESRNGNPIDEHFLTYTHNNKKLTSKENTPRTMRDRALFIHNHIKFA